MDCPKISVIVPVYNTEKQLDRCIQSIVGQTYENLEIILVDDGSPDGCPAICDEWARRDDRIKVIHKANGGLPDARNAGMRAATGSLIGFVDSDDYISAEMYSELYANMLENDSDISVCGIELFWDDKTPSKPLTMTGAIILDNKSAVRAAIEETWLKQPVVNKLYKAELLVSIPFDVGKQHEDTFWSYKAAANAKTVSVFDTLLYHYYQNPSSIMGRKYSIKRFDVFDALFEQLAFMKKNYPDLVLTAQRSYIGALRYHYQYISRLKGFDDDKKHREMIYKRFTDAYTKELYQGMSFKEKIWLRLFRLSPDMCCKIRNSLKIGL